MSTVDLASLVNLLQSTKVKDRNDALTHLEQVASSRVRLSLKQLRLLATAVFLLIEYESRAYGLEKSTLHAAGDMRLNSASYSLRLLVQKSVDDKLNVKYKVYMDICVHIINLFYIQDVKVKDVPELLLPCTIDFVKIIAKIMSVAYFIDHLSNKEWSTLYSFLIRAIDYELRDLHENVYSQKPAERILTELWLALELLLNCESATCGIQIYQNKQYFKLLAIVNSARNVFKKESPIYISLFKVINKMIAMFATEDVKFVNKMISIGLDLLLNCLTTNWERLYDQFLIFLNLPSTHHFVTLEGGLPKLDGDCDLQLTNILEESEFQLLEENKEGSKDKTKMESKIEDLNFLLIKLEKLILFFIQSTSSASKDIVSKSIGLSSSLGAPSTVITTWSCLENIHLVLKNESRSWLLMTATVRLLHSYYNIKSILGFFSSSILSSSSPSSSKLRDGRIYRGTSTDILKSALIKSDSAIEFCAELLSATSLPQLRIKGLKTLTFYLEIFPFPLVNEKGNVLGNKFENGIGNGNGNENEVGEEKIQEVTSNATGQRQKLTDEFVLLAANETTNTSFDFTVLDDTKNTFNAETMLRKITDSFDIENSGFWNLLLSRTILFLVNLSAFRERNVREFVQLVLLLSFNELHKEQTFTVSANVISFILENFRHDMHKLIDDSILTQLETAIDFPEANGPFTLHDESFSFWYNVYQLVVDIDLSKRTILPTKIAHWLLAKWDMVFCKHSHGQQHRMQRQCMWIPQFLIWLSGGEICLGKDTMSSTNPPKIVPFSNLFKIQEESNLLEQFMILQKLKRQISYKFIGKLEGIAFKLDDNLWDKVLATHMIFSTGNPDYIGSLLWLLNTISLLGLLESSDISDLSKKSKTLQDQLSKRYDLFSSAKFTKEIVSHISEILVEYLPCLFLETSKIIYSFPFHNIFKTIESFFADTSKSKKRRINIEKEEDEEGLVEKKNYQKITNQGTQISDDSLVFDKFMSETPEAKLNINLDTNGNENYILNYITLKRLVYKLHALPNEDLLSELVVVIDQLMNSVSITNNNDNNNNNIVIDALSLIVDEILPLALSSTDSTTASKSLIRLIGAHILMDQRYEKKECILVMISRCLQQFFTFCNFANLDPALQSDISDVVIWLHTLGSKDFITSKLAIQEFVQFCIAYLQNNNEGILPRQVVMNEALRQFQVCPNVSKIFLQKSFSKLMTKLRSREQQELYSKLFDAFDSPQSGIEVGATFAMFLSGLSTSLTRVFLLSLFNLVECSRFPHLLPYLKLSIQRMTDPSELTSFANVGDIFTRFKTELLHEWWIHDLFDTFPISVFGFQNYDIFVLSNYREITACVIGTKIGEGYNKRVETVLQQITELRNSPHKAVINESLALILPYAYTKDGVGNKVFDIIFQINNEYRANISEQLPLIILETIKLIDVHLESDMNAIFVHNNYNKTLFDGTSKLDVSSNLTISLKIGMDLVTKLIDKFQKPREINFWRPSVVYFLLRQQSLLLSPQSTSVLENISILRRIKLLILIGGGGGDGDKGGDYQITSSYEIFNLLTRALLPLLNNQSLSNDVFGILMCFDTLFKKVNKFHMMRDVIVLIIHSMFKYWLEMDKGKRTTLHNGTKFLGMVKNWLLSVDVLDSHRSEYTVVTSALSKLVGDESKLLKIRDVMTCLHENTTHSLLMLISAIFHEVDCTEVLEDRKVTDFIINLNSSVMKELSSEFKVWIATYLSNFTSSCENAKELDFVQKPEFINLLPKQKTKHFSFYNSALLILSEILTNNHLNENVDGNTVSAEVATASNGAVSSCSVAASIETITGAIMWCYEQSPKSVTKFFEFDEFYNTHKGYILSLNISNCVLLNVKSWMQTPKYTLEEISRNTASFFNNHSDDWCVALYLALLEELVALLDVARILGLLVIEFPYFAEQTLTSLICLYLQTVANDHGLDNIVLVLNNFTTMKHIPKSASKSILQVVLTIRLIAKSLKIPAFEEVYKEVLVEKYYRLASRLKMYHTAMMLFEDAYFTNGFDNRNADRRRGDEGEEENDDDDDDDVEKEKEKEKRHDGNAGDDAVDKEYSELHEIYENVDSTDLIYGLSEMPTFDYALSMINKNGTSGEQLSYNSGIFDASIKLEGGFASEYAHSLANVGMLGTSDVMSKFSNTTVSSDERYEWSWKLSKWDQPVPRDMSGPHALIYSTLKQIRDHPAKLKEICRQSILIIVECDRYDKEMSLKEAKESTRRWLESITVVQSISDIMEAEGKVKGTEDVERKLSQQAHYTNDIQEFTLCENKILARETALQIMAQALDSNFSTGIYWSKSLTEMVKYNNLARLNGEQQKMVSSMVMINSISKKLQVCGEGSFHQNMQNLSLFQTAQTMWAQGNNTNVPVLMLKELYKLGGVDVQDANLKVDKLLIRAMMVKWMSESRQELALTLMNSHVLPTAEKAVLIPDLAQQTKIYRLLANFCEEQAKSRTLNERLKQLEKRVKGKRAELLEMKLHKSDGSSLSDNERRAFNRFYLSLKNLYEKTETEYIQAKNEKRQFSHKAVEFYLQSLAVGSSSEKDLDKFVALWLDLSNDQDLHAKVRDNLLSLPTHKLVTWCAQFVSRLSSGNTLAFQTLLKLLIRNICVDHPYHSLHLLLSLQMQKDQAKRDANSLLMSKVNAAQTIWDELLKQETSFVKIVLAVQHYAHECVDLAKLKTKRGQRSFSLYKTKQADYWINGPLPSIPPLTKDLPLDLTLKYDNIPIICSINNVIQVAASGLSAPKIGTFLLSDGSTHKMLFKSGTDDLRQDFIMEQVFRKVNNLFKKDRECNSRNLTIRTYNAIPLGPNSGVIEFVPNSSALLDCIYPYHKKFDQISYEQARAIMHEAQTLGKERRIQAYKEIETKVKPVLKLFFQDEFLTPDSWFQSRMNYSRGLAASSIVGYILGLGDRHCNNILLDKLTGEPIHIDLGVAFDQGKKLPIPETVPFRLTRDMVSGLGVTGVEGLFKKSCEHTMRVLRENKEHILSILDVLRWDPFYSWTVSPLRKKKLQNEANGQIQKPEEDGSEAEQAVLTVLEKLIANDLSVEAAVRELVQEATSVDNLALIYKGWSPFF